MIGAEPRVIVAIFGEKDAKLAQTAQDNGADLIELRLDLYPLLSVQTLVDTVHRVKEVCRLPLIGTIRLKAEGGGFQGDEGERRRMFLSVLPLIDAIDIELSAAGIISEVVSEAKAQGKTIIISHHNFYRTPPDTELETIANSAKQAGADIVKLAATANSLDDLSRLLLFSYTTPHKPISCISMGELGAPSRFIAPLFGSCLTYAHLSDSTAPGQFTLYELQERLKIVFPWSAP